MRITALILLMLLAAQASAQLGFCEGSKGDPIFHEDFGTGNSFGPALSSTITNYTYVSGYPEDGQYTIYRDATFSNGWHQVFPATTESGGKALIVNASYTSGQFYKTEVTGLCQNTTYEFSTYIMNLLPSGGCSNNGIPVNVRFEIWDETDSFKIKEGNTGPIHSTTSPQWRQFALTFRSEEGQGSVILKLYNNGEGGCGNDLAIDDFIFRSCGDLTTITNEETSSDVLEVCEEEAPAAINLKATPDFSVYSDHFFQWQESSDNETWSDILGETADNFSTSSVTSSTYFRVKVAEDQENLKDNLCSSATESFYVNIIDTPDPPVSNGDQAKCVGQSMVLSVEVGSGQTVNWYDAPVGGNLLAEGTATFSPQEEGVYYAEAVRSNYNCEPGDRTAVTLTIYPVPELQDESIYLCAESSVVLGVGNGYSNYSWSTGADTDSIEVSEAGTYTVEVTNSFGCPGTKLFEVMAADVPVIQEVVSEERMLMIEVEDEGDFEYSIDGSNFQQSNTFQSVDGGIYTAYVRDMGGCLTATREFAHIVVPQYITPNNDGHNDYFELKGLSYFSDSEIRIFNRYGKLLMIGPGENFRWDGSVSGRALSADDYWYEIYIEGFETKRGNFSLIR